MAVSGEGQVGILNVGAGDIKLSFDPKNPAERIRAARIVKDMLRRGYALLIEYDDGGETKHRRAVDFDESACTYIIADYDPLSFHTPSTTETGPNEQVQDGGSRQAEEAPREGSEAPKRRGRPPIVRSAIPAERVKATAVGRAVGG